MKVPILYIDNTYTFGGAINSLEYLLRGLNREEFVPVLVTAQSPAVLRERFDFVKWYHFNMKLPWVHNKYYRKLVDLKIFSTTTGNTFLRCLRLIYWLLFITVPEALTYWKIGQKHNVRLVHLNNIFGSQVAGILGAKLLKVPCVAHLRDFEEVSRATRFYTRLVDHHVAISGSVVKNLISLGVPKYKISKVYDGIDLDKFREELPLNYLKEQFKVSDDTKLFGIFGRIIDWKGIKEFVQAAQIVLKSVPNSKAFIVGDASDGSKSYFSQVKYLIEAHGLDKRIVLTGYREDIPAFMSMMDIIVHASIRPEPFGMVLVEAMALGKPVVAMRAGGPLDIVKDGTTGLLVEPGNINELADAITLLLSNEELARAMGAKGKERARYLFNKERYAKQIESIYHMLLRTCNKSRL